MRGVRWGCFAEQLEPDQHIYLWKNNKHSNRRFWATIRKCLERLPEHQQRAMLQLHPVVQRPVRCAYIGERQRRQRLHHKLFGCVNGRDVDELH